MSRQDKPLYECGPFRLDPLNHSFSRDGVPIPLPPKAFETLLVLVEHRGNLVEKEQLLKAVWPDTFVEENNLTQYISLLRKVLGDGPDQRQYIETVPRLGYRFVAPVREVKAGADRIASASRVSTEVAVPQEDSRATNGSAAISPTTTPPTQPNRRLTTLVLIAVGLTIAAAAISYRLWLRAS